MLYIEPGLFLRKYIKGQSEGNGIWFQIRITNGTVLRLSSLDAGTNLDRPVHTGFPFNIECLFPNTLQPYKVALRTKADTVQFAD